MNTQNLIYVHPLAVSEERNVIKERRTVNISSLLLFRLSVYCSKMSDCTGYIPMFVFGRAFAYMVHMFACAFACARSLSVFAR